MFYIVQHINEFSWFTFIVNYAADFNNVSSDRFVTAVVRVLVPGNCT